MQIATSNLGGALLALKPAATTPGCPSDAASRASRSNRLRNVGSATYCGLITFTATGRSRRVSRPRYTVDMPPRAIIAPSRYRPSSTVPLASPVKTSTTDDYPGWTGLSR